ncbi:dual specificity protein phosphatase 18 [Megalops cyprinoides]|uniref:dual specificity protein phosphatase 18 n=1 Tax=Megalops cyprinoides TaxID=118141 RepID=UPI0018656097|nr:dual specificity protein phosphatase 18 [Megalops cyprinoides]
MSVSQITPSLFLSGADAALNKPLLSRKGITLIINATLEHSCPVYRGVQCLRVPVADLPHSRLGDHFDRVAERIHKNRTGGTLVHCAAGMSRSPALVMAYLMRYKGVTLREAHHWVQDSRPSVRPNAGFWRQLLDYEKKLYGKNTVKVELVDYEDKLYGKNTVKVASPLVADSIYQSVTMPVSPSQGIARYCLYR